MLYDIAIIGDCVQDMFILARSKIKKEKNNQKYLSFPYGEKINIDELHYDLGGSACNAGVAMKKLGLKTTMVSMVGDDIYSRGVIEELKKKKVNTSFLIKEKNKDLGLSFILLGSDRDRTILTYRTNNDFNKIRLRKIFLFSKSFYLAGINRYSKILQKNIYKYILKSRKLLYINPSIFQIEEDKVMLKKLIKKSEIAILNVEEAKKILYLKKNIKLKNLLKLFKKLGPKIVVITDGIRGASCTDGKIFLRSGIYSSKRIDTTGAGDSFAATFVATYKKGFSLDDCLKFATINAANVVSIYGAQRGLLGEKEIIKRYKKNKVEVRRI